MRTRARIVMATLAVLGLALFSSPAQAAFPGQNGKIAFVRGDDIWTMNPDGTGQVNLTNSAAVESNPAWSPDGNQIAFDRKVGSLRQLHVMFADGTGVTQIPISTFPGNERFDPAWSPDGSQLVYSLMGEGALAKVNTDGSGETPIFYGDTAAPDGAAWSPNGSRIAFNKESDLPPCVVSVATINPDGSGFFNVTCAHDDADFSSYPNWSPDGTRIAYGRDDTLTQAITTIDPDGTDQMILTGASGVGPAWSPDGSKIAFVGSGGINVMNSNGTGVIPIATGAGPDWQPIPHQLLSPPQGRDAIPRVAHHRLQPVHGIRTAPTARRCVPVVREPAEVLAPPDGRHRRLQRPARAQRGLR